ncbi:leucine-rich repeats and immunoglobulin-like domains protein 1 isoform X1 [Bufo bufo]|uniref:leucine-rich repeats and immunoglobulin-like domains protein 1 isoform X1 n=1 Tax=Bufo bufo TaxID=8384 RepID=UPI001ABE5C6A|nr:leucine-rich repeats and immunoglobulin-like domains protein 1 isoform X1 [Bufo bufo]
MQPRAGRSLLLDLSLLLLILGCCLASRTPCPTKCTCTGNMVDCSNLGLTEVPPDIPAWATHLNLSHNKLKEIDPAAFVELQGLREVHLGYNELSAIPFLGSAASQIVSLSLHHNKIRNIEPRDLLPYTSLETLDLSANDITEIRSGSFPLRLRIKDLNLGSNKLSRLESGSFDNLSRSLLTLRLSKNRISQLPVRAFKLPLLTQLELSRNRIRLIEGLTFQGLDSLEILKLQRNNISKLTDGAFWGLARMQVLHLEHNSLTEVNSGSLYGLKSLQQLYLGNNSISKISSGGWSFCQKLQELVLSHNKLTRLDQGSLADLGSLTTLRLSHNSINLIAEGAFKGLQKLRLLELDHNEISGTIEDTNRAFQGLDSLNKLTLFGNKIKSVARNAFSGLGALEHLNLGGNAMRSVQAEAFGEMKMLKELYVNSESFLCDCDLKWLPPWLISRKLQSNVRALCAHPESIQNKSIFIIPARSFVCDDLPKPQIIVHPQKTMAVVGKDIRFSCSAASSSSSPMTFVWKKNNEILHNAETENFANAREKDGDVINYTTILHLRNVTFDHDGQYQCIITNHFGSTYSNKAGLTVNVLPYFTKTPRDSTIRTGTTARLECAADGHPTPDIAWQKDGGTDFPAARERRMHVMPDDDVFFITDIKIEDIGVYSCTAQNSAGLVSANATLTILEMPFLAHPLEDRVVSAGSTLSLQCKASGSPPPRITWLKGDEPLVMTKRHHFTSGNELLIILNVVQEDAGKYTCEMSNTLGTERAYSNVSIYPTSGCVSESSRKEGTMTYGIITIVVVCSIVLTSLVWVCIIYQTRKKSEEYSVTNTDETIVPPDVPSYLSSQGICSSDGIGNTDVEACNVGYRQPRLCIGCNSDEPCKTADGLFSTDNNGYGYQVVCTDCLEGRAVYSKDPDYCPQLLPSIDCSYEKPQSVQDSYRNDIEHSHLPRCQQSHSKMDASEFVYPSNHERVPLFCEQKSHILISDAHGSHLEPLIRSHDQEKYQQPPAPDGLIQRSSHISDPPQEAKLTVLSNGHTVSPSPGEHRPHNGSCDAK